MIDGASTPDDGWIRLTLFVAPNSRASALAVEHMQRSLEGHESRSFRLEIVDVVADPQRCIGDRVLVTPTLLAREFGQRVVGDLGNASLLEYFLRSLLMLRARRA